ncbi:hypothetical protein GJV03_09575 [Acinetobacter sp. RIT698]|nr:hypothetical protein F7P82_10090 [Acinetobacter guillouiae]MRT37411.1 hypothetical protein [Acinetobacter sp. RIT698]
MSSSVAPETYASSLCSTCVVVTVFTEEAGCSCSNKCCKRKA